MSAGYHYLATVYSKHRLGIDIAWRESCRHAALFIKAGVPVFCPIAHTHPIAIQGLINPYDHGVWLPADRPLMEGAVGLIVVTGEGWLDSVGIAAEIDHFKAAGKPITYWSPGQPIPEFLREGVAPHPSVFRDVLDDYATALGVAGEIAVERKRQIVVEGYSAAHDDAHAQAELARAGAAFALRAANAVMTNPPHEIMGMSARAWPFDRQGAPRAAPRRMLVIAAALMVAEIERLDRRETEGAQLRGRNAHGRRRARPVGRNARGGPRNQAPPARQRAVGREGADHGVAGAISPREAAGTVPGDGPGHCVGSRSPGPTN